MDKKVYNVAIVGGGVSGMSAAYLLTKGGHKVTVYEKGDYFGGHTNTVSVEFNEKLKVNVDTGFIIYTQERYKNLDRLFKELDVESTESDMSFAFSLNNRDIKVSVGNRDDYDDGANTNKQVEKRKEVEWGSDNIISIFAQVGNLFRYSFWRMILDLIRFSKEGPKILDNPDHFKNITIRQYVTMNGYSEGFVNYYLIPVMSSLWSTSFKEIDQFPILTLARFFGNHNMFQLFKRPTWQTVTQGSSNYMKKIHKFILDNGGVTKLSSPVTKIDRDSDAHLVYITDQNNSTSSYEYVIMACHPPDIFPMISEQDLTEKERLVLSAFKYTHHTVYLHSDPRLMPKRERVWSSWNYIYDDNSQTDHKVCVSYWMNKLQPWLDKKETPLFVTLNPVIPVDPNKIHKVIQYDHPLYTTESVDSREKVTSIQGIKKTFYAGAYYGHGFHEDGIISGLLAAQSLDPTLKNIWDVDLSRYQDTVPKSVNESKGSLMSKNKILAISSVILLSSTIYYNFSTIVNLLNNFK